MACPVVQRQPGERLCFFVPLVLPRTQTIQTGFGSGLVELGLVDERAGRVDAIFHARLRDDGNAMDAKLLEELLDRRVLGGEGLVSRVVREPNLAELPVSFVQSLFKALAPVL